MKHDVFASKGSFELYNTFMKVFDTNNTAVHQLIHADGLAPVRLCLMFGMAAFDAPNTLAFMRQTSCTVECTSSMKPTDAAISGMDARPLSRFFGLSYTVLQLLPFWVVATPIVSFIWGSYLCWCVNFLHIHTNEAFSSLRIQD